MNEAFRDNHEFRLLLVGNYEPDGQESMQRFAQLLHAEFTRQGLSVTWLKPLPCLFRLAGIRANPHRGAAKILGYLDKFLIFPWRLWRESRRHDLVHICDHSNAMYGAWTAGKPWVLTCNDLLAVRSALGEFASNPTRWSGRVLQRWILKWLGRAPWLACISAATQEDVLRLTRRSDRQMEVVHMGLNHPYRRRSDQEWRPAAASVLESLGRPPDQRFILHVGGNQWYKNRRGVIDLFAGVAGDEPGLHLILAGKPATTELEQQIARLGLSGRIHFTGTISNADLEALYHAAEFLLFPSLAEGFGWPVVEAQACGCRVACTHRPPLPEVGGPGCIYLDLDDTVQSRQQLLTLLREPPSERETRVQAGLENVRRFEPDLMARRYRNLYARALQQG